MEQTQTCERKCNYKVTWIWPSQADIGGATLPLPIHLDSPILTTPETWIGPLCAHEIEMLEGKTSYSLSRQWTFIVEALPGTYIDHVTTVIRLLNLYKDPAATKAEARNAKDKAKRIVAKHDISAKRLGLSELEAYLLGFWRVKESVDKTTNLRNVEIYLGGT